MELLREFERLELAIAQVARLEAERDAALVTKQSELDVTANSGAM